MSTDTSPRWGSVAPPATWVSPLRASTQAAAFWLAVAFPLAYLPAILLATPVFADPVVLASAVVGNLLALVVGHGHQPSFGRFSRGD